jgi:hypothetical protein
MLFAVDFESYYDDDCNVKKLGIQGYIAHEKFDPYLVAVVGLHGFKYVGDPHFFDWKILHNAYVVSHNAEFDRAIYHWGVIHKGWLGVRYLYWSCTAELCSTLGIPRSLKASVAEVYGVKLNKDIRDFMFGRKWKEVESKFKQEVRKYALKDAEFCLRLYLDLS